MGTLRISGALGWLLLLAATSFTVILAAPSTGHGYETKSFAQAYLECLQYLNISRQSMYWYDTAAVPANTGGNCLLRCIGLNTRWWSDEAGLSEKALVRFFRQTDSNALDQARTCMTQVADTSDTCAAAYQSFRCYSDALGEVIAHPEYIVPCREEIHRAVSDCATMLQVSDEQLSSCVAAETFQHSGNATALLRCVVLRLGLYADSTGVMCDRLQLLMDSGTAQSWAETHAEEAKRCENDLRELSSDVCLVAAHSVEICYGWKTFGELWKVLKEEYGTADADILYDHAEESFTESNEVVEKKQEQQTNDIRHVSKEVEVFSYPSGSRYRSLLILNPNWNVDDSKSDSSDSSSSQEEKTSGDEKLETAQLPVIDAEKPANSNDVVKQQAVPEPEERSQPETEHNVQTRSVVYPMAHGLCPYCRPVLPPYALRMRRSIPFSRNHPHAVPVLGTHYFHPMPHPVVKRSIPMQPMFVPVYPARFARDVDSTDSFAGLGGSPFAEFVDITTASKEQQDGLAAVFGEDGTASKNEELGMEASGNDEDSATNNVEAGVGSAYEEPNVPAPNQDTDDTLNDGADAYDETEQVSSSNVAGDETENDAVASTDENSNDTLDDNAMPLENEGNAEDIEGAPVEPEEEASSNTSTDVSQQSELVQPSLPEGADRTPQPETPSTTPVADESDAATPKALNTAQRLIRAVRANMLRNFLSALTKQ